MQKGNSKKNGIRLEEDEEERQVGEFSATVTTTRYFCRLACEIGILFNPIEFGFLRPSIDNIIRLSLTTLFFV